MMSSLTPYAGTPGEEIDPSVVAVYRGGSLQATPTDLNIDPITGNLRTTHGVSLETDAAALARFGQVRQIKSIPPTLKIIQRGRRLTHFEIVPRLAMSPDDYHVALTQVQLS